MSRYLQVVTFLLCALLVAAATVSAEPPPGMARATFVVHCYDVGASALAGEPGVISVERGWSGAREVDRVVYDPQQVSLSRLESRLREAGTYVRTLEVENKAPATGEMAQ